MSFIHIRAHKEGVNIHLIAAKLKFPSLTGFSTAVFRGNKISRGFYARWNTLDLSGIVRSMSVGKKRRFPGNRILSAAVSPTLICHWPVRKSMGYRHLALARSCLGAKRGSGVLPHTIGDALIRGWLRNAACVVSVSFITVPCLISAPATWLRQSRHVCSSALPKISHTRMCMRDLGWIMET